MWRHPTFNITVKHPEIVLILWCKRGIIFTMAPLVHEVV